MNREEIRKKWKNRELAEVSQKKLARQEETPKKQISQSTWERVQNTANQIMNIRNNPIVNVENPLLNRGKTQDNKQLNKKQYIADDARALVKGIGLGGYKGGVTALGQTEFLSQQRSDTYRKFNQRQTNIKEQKEAKTANEQLQLGLKQLQNADTSKGVLIKKQPSINESASMQYFNKKEEELNKKIAQNAETASTNAGKYLAGQVAPSMGQSLVGTGLDIIAPGMGAGYRMLSYSGNYTQDGLNKGMNENQASMYGLTMAGVETAMDTIGDKLKGIAIGEAKGANGLKNFIKTSAKELGINSFFEGSGEALTEPLQELVAKAYGGKADYEGIAKRMGEAFLAGAVSELLMTGASLGYGGSINVLNKTENGQQVSVEEVKNALNEIKDKKQINVEEVLQNNIKFAEDNLTQDNKQQQIENSGLTDIQKQKLTEISQKYDLSQKDIQDLIDNTKNGKYQENQATTTPNNEILNQEQQTIQQEGKQAQNQALGQQEENKQIDIKNDIENFSKQVDDVINGTLENKRDMLTVLNKTPKPLLDIGLNNYPITLTQKHLKTILNKDGKNKNANYHDLGIDLIKQLPEAINNPLDIVKSNTRDDSVVLTTSLEDKQGRTVVASIKIDGKGKVNDIIIDSNVMTSAYGRNNYESWMDKNLKEGKLLYDIDRGVIKKINSNNEKEKTTMTRLQLPRNSSSSVDTVDSVSTSNNIIPQNEQNMQVPQENIQEQQAKQETPVVEQPAEQTVKEEKQIDKYNKYKKKIIEKNEQAINNLISYKNQTTTELEDSIAKKQALLDSKKNKNTKVANNLKMQIENLKTRKAEIENMYNERIDKFNTKVDKKIQQEVQRQMKEDSKKILEAEINPLIEDSDNWVDKKAGIFLNTETAERNIEDIVKDKEKAQQINEAIFKPIHEHVANAQRGAQENYDRINDLKLDKKKKYTYIEDENGKHIEKPTKNSTTYKVDEATLAQLLIEKKINENDLKEYGVDVEKIKNTAEVFKDILENYYDKMNETVVKYGYAPIGKIENYFPHFTENKPDTLLGKVAGLIGIDTTNQELPTEISGRTEQFKPGKVWNSNILKRLGNKTDYDALKIMERYIMGAEDIINTTDDIQKLRQFSKALRYKYSEKAIQDEIESFENNEDLTVQQKEESIENLLISRNDKLYQLNHFATWLDDYTNMLANKKNSADREFEKNYNRSMYKNMSAIESRIAANTIGGNASVSLTNFAPLFQAFGSTKASNLGTAMLENMRNSIFDIVGIPYTDYVQNSDFLISRFGTDGISKKTALQKVENVLATPMEFADRISAETIVRAKYRENLASGMNEEEALKKADDYARRIMADRSKGALPVAFNNKNPISKLFTMYQVEPNNLLRNYFKDMPRNAQNSKQLAWQYMKLMGSSWAFNTLAMAIRGGNEVLPDPIRLATYLMKYFTSDDDDEKEQAGKDIQEAIFGVLPFAQNIGGFLGLEDIGRVPISNAMPDLTKLGDLLDKDLPENYRKETFWKELSKPILYLGMPVRRCAIRKNLKWNSNN